MIKEQHQPSPEEIQKAEDMMSEQQAQESLHREKGYDLLGLKEKLRNELEKPMLIEKPLGVRGTAEMLFDRYKSVTKEIKGHGQRSIGYVLMHIGHDDSEIIKQYDAELINDHYMKKHEALLGQDYYKDYGNFPSAFIHEYLGIAKDYIKNDKRLNKEEKIQVMGYFTLLLGDEFRGGGVYELSDDEFNFEFKVHGRAFIEYLNQIKQELAEELGKEE